MSMIKFFAFIYVTSLICSISQAEIDSSDDFSEPTEDDMPPEHHDRHNSNGSLLAANFLGGRSSDPYEGYEAEEVMNLSPVALLRLRGFEAEVHYATTKDGYKVHVVRVVNPALAPSARLKRPVIFNHGLFESATIWLINSRNVKPMDYSREYCRPKAAESHDGVAKYLNGPMMLANAGHDVWLMSMRGTEFSLKHTNMKSSNESFWNYSLDDFGLTDVPTVVDYVRAYTRSAKVGYVGHSQATFSVFALLSKRPVYADRIEPVVAIAPVAYFHHITSVARGLFVTMATTTAHDKHGPFPQNAPKARRVQGEVCGNFAGSATCSFTFGFAVGMGGRWPRGYFTHMPFYTSLKVLRHFGQLVLNKQFEMYDYGAHDNLIYYGRPEVPKYKIERIRSKSLCLFTAKEDTLSTPQDIDLFIKRLRVPVHKLVTVESGFNHQDLITHPNVDQMVFRPIMDIMDSFELKETDCMLQHNQPRSVDSTKGDKRLFGSNSIEQDFETVQL